MENQTQEIQINIRYIQEDFFKPYVQLFYLNTLRIIIIILTPVLLSGLVLILLFRDASFSIDFTEAMVIAIISAFMLVSILKPFLNKRIIERKLATTHQDFRETTLVAYPEGLTFINKTCTQRLLWCHMYQIIELKDYFCIYMNQFDYRAIPKRGLTTEQRKALRGFLYNNGKNRYITKSFKEIEP